MSAVWDALPSGLRRSELATYVRSFGVAEEQIHRDHLISVLLAALSDSPLRDRVVFIGGTALSRTHLRDSRLSEDIDLLAVVPRAEVLGLLPQVFGLAVARSHGRSTWQPDPTTTKGAQPTTFGVEPGLRVQVQVVSDSHFPPWPTAEAVVEQRYSDVRPARLRTLTLEGFVAAKTSAWIDRRAPRDLYDLHGLALRGAITPAAAALFRRLGPTGRDPGAWEFERAPSDAAWKAALGHQCRLRVGPAEALRVVARSWAASAD